MAAMYKDFPPTVTQDGVTYFKKETRGGDECCPKTLFNTVSYWKKYGHKDGHMKLDDTKRGHARPLRPAIGLVVGYTPNGGEIVRSQ